MAVRVQAIASLRLAHRVHKLVEQAMHDLGMGGARPRAANAAQGHLRQRPAEHPGCLDERHAQPCGPR